MIILFYLFILFSVIMDAQSPVDIDNLKAGQVTMCNIPVCITGHDSADVAHPDVLYFPEGFGGYKYWMVFTPLPAGDNLYENPNIAASNDGLNFIVPDSLFNPIDMTHSGHLSDPDLVFCNNLLYCFYRLSDNNCEWIFYKTSRDGIKWGQRHTLITSLNTTRNELSPAVLFDGGLWRVWTVEANDHNKFLKLRIYNKLTDEPEAINTNLSRLTPSLGIWHVNVIKKDNYFYAVINATSIEYGGSDFTSPLFLAYSSDGISWIVAKGACLDKGGDFGYYRSSLMLNAKDSSSVFSLFFNLNAKRIGYTELKFRKGS